ncbi:MAG: hypothetical protein HZB84_07710 [Deltaproteobacteria bacterium]|nr:hypothetical protein [Deltaproteobacteria bacterium]
MQSSDGPYKKIQVFLYLLSFTLVLCPAAFAAAASVSAIRFVFTLENFYDDKFKSPAAVYIDKKNKELYVADSGNSEVFIFDTKGTPIFRIGPSKGVVRPFSIAIKDSRIYLSEEGKNHVDILSYRGEPIKEMKPGDVPFVPGRVSIDDEGKAYVINKAATNCMIFDKNDEFAGYLGARFESLADVAVSKDRIYLLTPHDRQAIQVYDRDGGFIRGFEALYGMGGTLGLPIAAKVDKYGLLWVLDAMNGIIVFDEDGKAVARMGESGYGRGQLFFPVDIDIDDEDMLYIAEKEAKRISVFKVER